MVLAAVLAVYVAYAHAASWRRVSQALEMPVALRFDRADWARLVEVEAHGIDATSEGGVLRVRAPHPEAGASLDLVGPVRSMGEVEVRLRFRLESRADVDVGAGMVLADKTASVGFGARDDSMRPSWRFFGQQDSHAPYTAIDPQRFVPLEAGGEHEIVLRVSPDLHVVLGTVDGNEVSSHFATWMDGTSVRPTIFVRARGARPIDLTILQCDWVPLLRDTRPRNFEDRFDGKVLDPVSWRLLRSDGASADGSFEPTGSGLRLRGRGLNPMRAGAVAMGLIGQTFRLGSFRARLEFEAKHLHRSRISFGVSNLLLGFADWRDFETGVADGPKGTDPFIAGQWEGDQQFQVSPIPGVANGIMRGELGLDYDAATGLATASIDGRVLMTRRLDFQPPEEVRVEIFTRVDERDADFELKLTHFKLESLPWKATPATGGGVSAWSGAGTSFFFDDFMANDVQAAYRTLSGHVSWGEKGHNVELGSGEDAPAAEDNEMVRGSFDGRVLVSGSLYTNPERGANDAIGVVAVDRDASTRLFARVAYGTGEKPGLQIVRRTAAGEERLATVDMPIELGKSYWVKMLVDRGTVHANAWLAGPGVEEPKEWAATATIDPAWTPTGGVGFAAIGKKTWAGWLHAE
jgi:hypothetical protein